MKVATFRYVVVVLTVVGVLTWLAGPSHAQFVLYDNFATGTIDPGLWLGSTTDGSLTAPGTELIRSAESGALQLRLMSWGNDTSTSGSTTTRAGLNFKQTGTFGASGSLIGIKTKVTIQEALAQDCATNPDASSNSRTRAQVIGTFFNDGSSTGPTDSTGNIVAGINVAKESDGSNTTQIFILKCTNSTCGTFSVPAVIVPTLATTWSPNMPLILKLRWDRANGKFKFLVRDQTTLATETAVIDYLGVVTDAGAPANGNFRALRVQNNVKNCSGDRKQVMIDALFDNVNVQLAP